MKNIRIYDNNGKTVDRYTVVFMDRPYYSQTGTLARHPMRECLGMSHSPFHPQGFCQHSGAMPGRHLGKRLKLEQLPPDCQRAIKAEGEAHHG